jgi:hypothetical protein
MATAVPSSRLMACWLGWSHKKIVIDVWPGKPKRLMCLDGTSEAEANAVAR